MVTILIYGGKKTIMRDKVEGNILQVAGISGVEETHLSHDRRKMTNGNKQNL